MTEIPIETQETSPRQYEIQIAIECLHAHPENHKLFHDIEGEQWDFFKADIQRNGIIQPLLVTEDADGETYTVLSGHQRLRAATALNMKTVPCLIWNDAVNQKDILISANMGRQLTTMERYRIAMHLLDQMEDGRMDNGKNKDEDGHFTDSVQNAPNREEGQDTPTIRPRDKVATMVPGVTMHDLTTFRKISEFPEPLQIEVFSFIEKANPNKRALKEKVNELNARNRTLKSELREERKTKLTKKEMEDIRIYNSFEHDPVLALEARKFDKINRATNTACIEIVKLVGAVFNDGAILRDNTAHRLNPSIAALSAILKEQNQLLLERWNNRKRSAADIQAEQELAAEEESE